MKKFGNTDKPFVSQSFNVPDGDEEELRRPTDQFVNNVYAELKNAIEGLGQELTPIDGSLPDNYQLLNGIKNKISSEIEPVAVLAQQAVDSASSSSVLAQQAVDAVARANDLPRYGTGAALPTSDGGDIYHADYGVMKWNGTSYVAKNSTFMRGLDGTADAAAFRDAISAAKRPEVFTFSTSSRVAVGSTGNTDKTLMTLPFTLEKASNVTASWTSCVGVNTTLAQGSIRIQMDGVDVAKSGVLYFGATSGACYTYHFNGSVNVGDIAEGPHTLTFIYTQVSSVIPWLNPNSTDSPSWPTPTSSLTVYAVG